jgi:hypothetical protein
MVFNFDTSDRAKYIDVAEKVQQYTIDLWETEHNKLSPIKNQSLGADLISSLSSKLIKSIFPFGQKFFRLYSSAQVDDPQQLTDMLIMLEEEILKEVSHSNIRGILIGLIENLLIAGNVLLDASGDKLLYYTLSEYIVERRDNGEWYRIVIQKKITVLPHDNSIYLKYVPTQQDTTYKNHSDYTYNFYIEITRQGDISTIKEYLEHELIKETVKEVKDLAVYPIWLYEDNGRNYSYGYAKRYLGDLHLYDTLSKITCSSSIIGSKVINLINPSSYLANNLQELVDARNGDFVVGGGEDITPFSSGVAYNLDWILSHMQPIEQRLSIAFLRGVGAVRDSERTTAFEVQMLISEMSEKFGGFYITISQSLQKPIFDFLLGILKINKKVGKGKVIEVEFLTGISELRNSEALQKLNQLVPLEAIYQSGLPSQILSYEKVLSLYAKHLGIRYDDILKDEEEIEAEEQMNVSRLQMEQQIKQQGVAR